MRLLEQGQTNVVVEEQVLAYFNPTPNLLALTGVTNSHGPQPTASRPPTVL